MHKIISMPRVYFQVHLHVKKQDAKYFKSLYNDAKTYASNAKYQEAIQVLCQLVTCAGLPQSDKGLAYKLRAKVYTALGNTAKAAQDLALASKLMGKEGFNMG